jgi:hypothetical protein
MNYALKFDPWSPEDQTSLVRFVLLYQAFLGTADSPNRSRSLEETRQAIKVLDGLADISDLMSAGTDSESRRLKQGGGTLIIDEVGLNLLKRSVEAYVGTVPFAMARTAMALKEFVDTAVKE